MKSLKKQISNTTNEQAYTQSKHLVRRQFRNQVEYQVHRQVEDQIEHQVIEQVGNQVFWDDQIQEFFRTTK